MPRLLITTQVYPPEIHPTSVMVRELATYLVLNGWEVDIVCGYPHHPTGLLPEGWKKELWKVEEENGYRVLRTWHLTSPNRSIPVRVGVYVSQAMGNTLASLVFRKIDLVLVYGPPLVGPGLGALVALRHGGKLINVVYDLYPDIAIETGKVTNPLVIGAARLAERFQYWAADLTIVLSEGFNRQLVAKGVPAEKIELIPVWLDPDEIKPMNRDNAWRREQGIGPDKFVVLYAGTIGIVSGAAMVADAASLLREREDIVFLFVGEGEEKPKLEARARELGLTNMRFLPFQPRERLPEVQATADLCLVTLLEGKGRTSVPSKVQGYMSAGRPVIGSVDADSDTAREIAGNQFGRVVAPGNPDVLSQAIIDLKENEVELKRLGQNARKRLVAHYSKELCLERFEHSLLGVLGIG